MTAAATKLLALLGNPVRHSRSPAMMSAAFAQLGIDATYVACAVDQAGLRDAVRGLVALGAIGANVTLPHKVAALKLCDVLDPAALAIGAVNTLQIDPRGRVVGYNTDAFGAVDALQRAGVDLSKARVAVLGSGGAARAVAVGLAQAGAGPISVRARDSARAAAVLDAVRLVGGTGDAAEFQTSDESVRRADVIVQATSAGLDGKPDDAAILAVLTNARRNTVAMDVVYTPLETRWLAAARTHGLHPVDGLGMLASQAARALSIWFAIDVVPDILRGFLDVQYPHG